MSLSKEDISGLTKGFAPAVQLYVRKALEQLASGIRDGLAQPDRAPPSNPEGGQR